MPDAVARSPSDTVLVEAPAKLNLFLRVLGRRPDGYHDLETAVIPLSLTDRLEIHAQANGSRFRTLSLSLVVRGDPELVHRVPADESNLVVRAAAALAEETGTRGFAEITLEKRIPAAGGLGGGSADAAATLRALNGLWGCGLDEARLAAVGAGVGSDIPALLAGGPVVARGRGELVDPASVSPMRWVLVGFPFGVRTADAFEWWDRDAEPVTGDRGREQALLDAAARGDQDATGRLLFNDLERPVIGRHPAIGEAKERLRAAGAVGVVMCGSGPTVAGLFPRGHAVDVPGAIDVESV